MLFWVLTYIYPLQVCGVYLKNHKGFQAFWPFSFTSPTVKGIDNLWKFRGIIDNFKNSRRKIASEVGETVYYSMSAIHFCTTSKVDIPHYSYIFRKPEPLGTEMKNVDCYRLGNMLHLEIHYSGLLIHFIAYCFLILSCFPVGILHIPVQKLVFSISTHNQKTL